jgi:hypothetical protein
MRLQGHAVITWRISDTSHFIIEGRSYLEKLDDFIGYATSCEDHYTTAMVYQGADHEYDDSCCTSPSISLHTTAMDKRTLSQWCSQTPFGDAPLNAHDALSLCDTGMTSGSLRSETVARVSFDDG